MYGRSARTFDDVEYAPEGKFKVVGHGAWLTGLEPIGQMAWKGWRRDLVVGEVIVCTGFGAGWGSDPGYGIEFLDPGGAMHVEVHPQAGGMWAYRPAPGILEPTE